jgi:hypothetical protein
LPNINSQPWFNGTVFSIMRSAISGRLDEFLKMPPSCLSVHPLRGDDVGRNDQRQAQRMMWLVSWHTCEIHDLSLGRTATDESNVVLSVRWTCRE